MLWTLIKSQILQVFAKMLGGNNKKNSGQNLYNGTGVYIIALIIVAVIGGCYFLGTKLYEVASALGVSWLYFSIFAVVVLVIELCLNVAIAATTLFGSKDNAMLLSLPIKQTILLFSRLTILVGNCLLVGIAVWLPAVLCFAINSGQWFVLGSGLVAFLVVSLAVLTISILIGWILSIVLRARAAKMILTILGTLLIIAVSVGFQFVVKGFGKNMASTAGSLQDMFSQLGIVAQLGKAVSEDPVQILLHLGVVAVAFIITVLIVKATYFKIMTHTAHTHKAKYEAKLANARSLSRVLMAKERQRFLSLPSYIVNEGLGVLFSIIAMIAAIVIGLAIKSDHNGAIAQMWQLIVAFAPKGEYGAAFIVTLVFLFMASLNIITSPSVSLEGNTFWLIRSLPIPTFKVLEAKENLHIMVNFIFVAVPCFISMIFLGADIMIALCCTVFLLGVIIIQARYGLILGTYKANFNWSNPAVPCKQSVPVYVSIFVNIAICVALGVGFFVLSNMDRTIFMCCTAGFTLVCLIVYYLLNPIMKTKVCRKFETL